MKPWKELRVDIAMYLTEVRHGALTRDQQARLADAWPTIYLMGKGAGCSEESWRNALGYSAEEWAMGNRERFALVLDKGDRWELGFLRAEIERQREHSRKQSERVSKRWNTTVRDGMPEQASVYPAVAVESTPKTHGLYLEANSGERWIPTQAQVSDWQVAVPGVDLDAEFARMRGWLDANPAKRKTLRGLPRFANGWLQRAKASAKPSPANDDLGVWGLTPKRGR